MIPTAVSQSAGVGGWLMLQAFGAAAGLRCTLSSSDPRALGLYIRAGLIPRWQNFLLRAEVLRGLITAYEHYEGRTESAWR